MEGGSAGLYLIVLISIDVLSFLCPPEQEIYCSACMPDWESRMIGSITNGVVSMRKPRD